MKSNLSVLPCICVFGILLLFQNKSLAQVSISLRYGKSLVNKEVYIPLSSFKDEATDENDFAFGVQIGLVKKWKLSLQAEIEIQQRAFQKQYVTYDRSFSMDSNGMVTINIYDVYEDVFYKVKYTANQFPIMLKKEFEVKPHLNLSVSAGVLLAYDYKGTNSAILYQNGNATTSRVRTPNNFVLDYEPLKSYTEQALIYDQAGNPLIVGLGISYDFRPFKIGTEYRYTKHSIIPNYSGTYHSLNLIMSYTL